MGLKGLLGSNWLIGLAGFLGSKRLMGLNRLSGKTTLSGQALQCDVGSRFREIFLQD